MDNAQYNLYRYNRKKQWYRIHLGVEQFLNYPLLNLIWLFFGTAVVLVVIFESKFAASLDVATMQKTIFIGSIKFFVVVFPTLCAIGLIQFVGEVTARKDEGNMSLVFGDRRDVKQQSPILISKRKMRKKNVIVREFYTTIPMERWQEKKGTIADILNITIVGEIKYGGKNNGNKIVLKTVKGRKLVKKDVLYDDTF